MVNVTGSFTPIANHELERTRVTTAARAVPMMIPVSTRVALSAETIRKMRARVAPREMRIQPA